MKGSGNLRVSFWHIPSSIKGSLATCFPTPQEILDASGGRYYRTCLPRAWLITGCAAQRNTNAPKAPRNNCESRDPTPFLEPQTAVFKDSNINTASIRPYEPWDLKQTIGPELLTLCLGVRVSASVSRSKSLFLRVLHLGTGPLPHRIWSVAIALALSFKEGLLEVTTSPITLYSPYKVLVYLLYS